MWSMRVLKISLQFSAILVMAGLLLCLGLGSCVSYVGTKKTAKAYQPREGDVLFQSLPKSPGLDIIDAIEGATQSPYSHCGVVVQKEGQWYVLEAMVPRAMETPLVDWQKRGRDEFTAFRLKEEHQAKIPAWIEEMRKQLGKPYDFRYRMSDEEIYCSELPFDAWRTLAKEDMGAVVKLGDLKWEKYRAVILAIEGSREVPVEREMITPRDLAAAPQLELVYDTGLSKEKR